MERLKNYLSSYGINLSQKQIDQFLKYYEMLIETNKVMNLTAITDFDEVVIKHFIDSVSIVEVNSDLIQYSNKCNIDNNIEDKDANYVDDYNTDDSFNPFNIIDIGTGAGFPGIPLKIVFPKLKIVLMDSLNKRVKFLQNVIDELGLLDITAIHGRAEEMARKKEYRECFDLCVSRAVANLSTLSEYCLPFVKVDGKFISYKASDIEDEVKKAENAINTLSGNLTGVNKLLLPETDIERAFVIIEKIKKTPKVYPRKAGTASKNPL